MREFEPADITNDFVQNISYTELNPVRWEAVEGGVR